MIGYYVIISILCVTYIQAYNNVLSPPYTCTTTTTICQPGDSTEHPPPSFSGPASQGRPGKRGMAGLPGLKGSKGDPCQCDIADEEAMREMRREMDELTTENRKMNEMMRKLEGTIDPFFVPTSCEQNRLTYKIYPWKNEGNLTSIYRNCELYSVDQDGWITIQKRQNGEVRFYDRNWESYARGFGNKDGEFWLGLRTIHQLTSTKNYKLRIDLRFKSGSVKYAEYSTFKVASEDSKFQLTISGYSGNADDRMTYHNGQYFTTYDVDNDNGINNCAQSYQGAWWYKNCHYSNLNGKYDNEFYWINLLAASEMKIHPV